MQLRGRAAILANTLKRQVFCFTQVAILEIRAGKISSIQEACLEKRDLFAAQDIRYDVNDFLDFIIILPSLISLPNMPLSTKGSLDDFLFRTFILKSPTRVGPFSQEIPFPCCQVGAKCIWGMTSALSESLSRKE